MDIGFLYASGAILLYLSIWIAIVLVVGWVAWRTIACLYRKVTGKETFVDCFGLTCKCSENTV